MKIGRVVKTSSQGVDESAIELDGWKVLTGLISAGLISGLIAAFTFFLVDLPNKKQERVQKIQSERFDLLNFALRSESDSTRIKTLIFLLESDILEDDDNRIRTLIEKNAIPDWTKMPKYKLSGNTDTPISTTPVTPKKKTTSVPFSETNE